MPTLRFSGGTQRSAPATSTRASSMVPLSGCSKPAINRRKVVLPQPEGPNSPSNSPWCRVNVIAETAGAALEKTV